MNKKLKLKRSGACALAIFSAMCLLASGLSARAGLQSQTDTNSLAANTTNTFLLYGDVTGSFTNGQQSGGGPYIVANRGDDLFVACGGFFTNTTAGSSNITFRIAQTVDFANWTNTATTVVVVVPPSSTNWAVGHALIQNAFPGYGLRTEENVNTGGVTGGKLYFKAFVKDGI